ncbi:YgfZ/GcvT domain-containing protein [Paragemmobacter straminiformis]|uniref:Folate-binding protein YgfZ n=1 Tax=Paragemmobacter straminiformis TaxID=2045119 RepID=A0A842IAH6_9RHOB|nr:folate-binding protein YgfZ [Gemmobacter straminiformis]MBC2836655.1 folate-binding protein YgfZ [Gemmobacter straminiformis]
MQGEAATGRVLWQVTGADALEFLQGLVSNDLLPLGRGAGIVWAALLTPQGKYLADFFVVQPATGPLLIDIAESLAPATLRRLNMYRLRADVQIAPSALHVSRGLGPAPSGALPDPRHPALGWRSYDATQGSAPLIDWDALRVAHVVPESAIELRVDDSYLLESGFERLHGVDFRKGCYVGQEVTARMKHKTELRKGLVRVSITGEAPFGTEIATQDGKPAGQLFTRSGNRAIAYLRLDRAEGALRAGSATVTLDPDQPS